MSFGTVQLRREKLHFKYGHPRLLHAVKVNCA